MKGLVADQRVFEVDRAVDAELLGGRQRHFLVSVAHRNLAKDHEELLGFLLLDDPRRPEETREGGGRAVHNGDFWTIQFDLEVVDAETTECSTEVLHGSDPHSFRPKGRRKRGVDHASRAGWDGFEPGTSIR